MTIYKKITSFIKQNQKKDLLILFFLSLLSSLLDVVGIASILPFITIILNPSIIETNLMLNKFYMFLKTFGFDDFQEFLFIFGIIVFIIFITSIFLKGVTNYLQIRFGYRPISADTFPILGPLDNHPQIIYATGNKRDGLTCSLEISQLIDQYINGDKYAFDKYKLFKPNRNLISYYDRNTAILKSAETIVAGKMMHNEYTKSQDWEKLVKREINQIKKLYSNLKSKSFGIHPELINMYKYKRI